MDILRIQYKELKRKCRISIKEEHIKDRKIKQNKIRPIDMISFILIKLIKLNSGKINKKV